MLKPSPLSPFSMTISSTNEDHIAPQLSASSDLDNLFGAGPRSGSAAIMGDFETSETSFATRRRMIHVLRCVTKDKGKDGGKDVKDSGKGQIG